MRNLFPYGFKNSSIFSLGKNFLLNATGVGAVYTAKEITLVIFSTIFNIVRSKKEVNKASIAGGEGNINYMGYLGAIIGVTVFMFTLYQLLTGQIDVYEFIELNLNLYSLN